MTTLALSTYERAALAADQARERLMATPAASQNERHFAIDPPGVPEWEQLVAWFGDVFELDYPNAVARVPTVFSCVTRISDDVASLPIIFEQYSRKERSWARVDDEHEAYRLWRDTPNAEQSGLELMRDVQAALDMVGGSYVYEDFGARGNGGGRLPDELWATPAHLMHPMPGPRRSIREYQYEPTQEKFRGDQMIPFRYWNPLVSPDPMSPVGLSPLSAARAAFMSRFRMGQWQDKFFESGGAVSHLFSVKDPAAFKPEQLEKMEKQLNKKRGIKHAFEGRVVSGVELLRAGITPREMQFIEAAQLTDKDICQVFKVPPVIIGIKEGGGMSDAGATTDLLLYADGCLAPRARLLSAIITRRFCNRYMPGVRAVVDISQLAAIQKAKLDQAAAVAKLTGNKPILSQNEARERIGEQPSADEGTDDLKAPTPAFGDPFGAGEVDDDEEQQPKKGGPRGGAPQRDREDEDRGPESKAEGARRSTARFARLQLERREQRQAKLRRRVDRDLARYERKLARQQSKRFTRQEDEVVAGLEARGAGEVAASREIARVLVAARSAQQAVGAYFASGLSLSLWDELLLDDPADLEAAQAIFDELIAERGEAAAAEIGEEVAIDVNQARLRTLIHNRASRMVSHTNATTRDRLTRAVAEAASSDSDEHPLRATIAAVRDVFKGRRENAEAIARTETMWAYNKGAEIAWRETGVRFKSWVTANDEAVRDSHQLCEDAGVVAFDSAFPNGLQYPGDESGPAEEVINCRCVLQPEFSEDEDEDLESATREVFHGPSRNGHHGRTPELAEWCTS